MSTPSSTSPSPLPLRQSQTLLPQSTSSSSESRLQSSSSNINSTLLLQSLPRHQPHHPYKSYHHYQHQHPQQQQPIYHQHHQPQLHPQQHSSAIPLYQPQQAHPLPHALLLTTGQSNKSGSGSSNCNGKTGNSAQRSYLSNDHRTSMRPALLTTTSIPTVVSAKERDAAMEMRPLSSNPLQTQQNGNAGVLKESMVDDAEVTIKKRGKVVNHDASTAGKKKRKRKALVKPYENGRKRAPTACMECKKKRVRCGFERPCLRCVKFGIECIECTPKKRGRKSRVEKERDKAKDDEQQQQHYHQPDLASESSQQQSQHEKGSQSTPNIVLLATIAASQSRRQTHSINPVLTAKSSTLDVTLELNESGNIKSLLQVSEEKKD